MKNISTFHAKTKLREIPEPEAISHKSSIPRFYRRDDNSKPELMRKQLGMFA